MGRPSDPNGKGIGKGGVPEKAGTIANGLNPTAYPSDDRDGVKATPGYTFSAVANKDSLGNLPMDSSGPVPDAYGRLLTELTGAPFGPTPPGFGTKIFTPGCGHGSSARGKPMRPQPVEKG
jgi:hypothetical protein